MNENLFLIIVVVLVVSLPTYFICKYKNRSYAWILFVNLSLMANKMYFIPFILIAILLILPKHSLISKFPRGERMKNVSTMNKEEYVKKYSDDTYFSRDKMKDEWEKENNNL
jgi:predicted membrane protein